MFQMKKCKIKLRNPQFAVYPQYLYQLFLEVQKCRYCNPAGAILHFILVEGDRLCSRIMVSPTRAAFQYGVFAYVAAPTHVAQAQVRRLAIALFVKDDVGDCCELDQLVMVVAGRGEHHLARRVLLGDEGGED